MIKQADRYTRISTHNSELEKRLNAAGELGLYWMILSDRDRGAQYSWLYLFFDESGKENYLTRVYGQVTDEIRAVIERHKSGETESLDALMAIDEML